MVEMPVNASLTANKTKKRIPVLTRSSESRKKKAARIPMITRSRDSQKFWKLNKPATAAISRPIR
jgi:hypothetical protein